MLYFYKMTSSYDIYIYIYIYMENHSRFPTFRLTFVAKLIAIEKCKSKMCRKEKVIKCTKIKNLMIKHTMKCKKYENLYSAFMLKGYPIGSALVHPSSFTVSLFI